MNDLKIFAINTLKGRSLGCTHAVVVVVVTAVLWWWEDDDDNDDFFLSLSLSLILTFFFRDLNVFVL